jgi:3-oxoacyl-[acyl-carrier protein] reductase
MSNDSGRLSGKVAVITGAGSGIGRASAIQFVKEGAKVVAADLNGSLLETLEEELGAPVVGVAGDLLDRDVVVRAVTTAQERFGALDIYFNNAGLPFEAKPVETIAPEEWAKVIAVNLTAIYVAATVVVPVMRARGGGSIIVTASMAALRPRPNLSAYTAAKGGAVALSKGLANELAPDNIRVNALCPVAANTPMLSQFGFGSHDQTAEYMVATTPLGRLAEADDVAAAAVYFASDESAFITGTAFPIDGGRGI